MLGLRFIPVSAARPGLQASGSEVLNGENDSGARFLVMLSPPPTD
jgi:hypothetical protein